eukprot:gene23794-biopygen24617
MYAGGLLRFKRWYRSKTPPRCPLPARPKTVAMYLQHLANSSKSLSKATSASGMIFTYHDLSLVPASRIPTCHPLVGLVRRGAQRRIGTNPKNRKEPLEYSFVIKGVYMLWHERCAVRRMIATLALLMWVAMCLSSVRVRDVRFSETHAYIFVESRKTDQFRFGQVIDIARASLGMFCPMSMLLYAWVSSCGFPPDAFLFQGFDGRSMSSFNAKPVKYHQVRRCTFAMLFAACGRPPRELQVFYGIHSLRIAAASVVAFHPEVPEHSFLQVAGWSDVRSS